MNHFVLVTKPVLIVCLICIVMSGQDKKSQSPSAFTGYPPSVYLGMFTSCTGSRSCVKTESFAVSPIPKGRCYLVVSSTQQTQGRITKYKVWLNDKAVVSEATGDTQTLVSLLPDNRIKVSSHGGPNSNLMVF